MDEEEKEQLLEKIEAAAVIGKSTAVHRKEFYALTQSPGEKSIYL